MIVFLEYLAEIDRAVLARHAMGLTALLRKRVATHLPREVREELLAFSRGARESLRAPVQFLRFQHRMMELARGGERLLTAQRELPLDGARADHDGEHADAGASITRRADGARRAAASRRTGGNGGRRGTS